MLAGPARGADERRTLDFIYVDANEGSASGGHVALRIDTRTYHFGHHEPGVLRLDRDDSPRFLRVYGVLENRNLRLHQIEVAPATFERVRASFNERFLEESAEYAAWDALRADHAFAERWARGEAAVDVRGAGYFGSGRSPGGVLDHLRRRIVDRHGPKALEARRRLAQEALAGLAAAADGPIPALAATGRHPTSGYGLRRRAADALGLLEALRVLETSAALRPETTVALAPAAFPVGGPHAAMLDRLARRIEDDLVEAFGSRRADAGFVLLVGMARLSALEQSRRRGHLVVLDIFAPEARRVAVGEIEGRGGRLPVLADAVSAELRAVGAVLVDKEVLREADLSALEGVANRHAELERARTTGADVRVAHGKVVPARADRRIVSTLAGLPARTAARRAGALRQREEELRTRQEAIHGYNLVGHNCVSELFAQMERAVGGPGASAQGATRGPLGGAVPAGRGVGVIPFVAAHFVEENLRVTSVVDIPSYRRRRVATMVEREGWPARLRESNVLTSTVYAPHEGDSAFLFFTDDRLVTRPLLGAVNLVYGLASAVVAVPLVPQDGGRRLIAGLRGLLWSLPELAFVNVRKGSFFFVPEDDDPRTVADQSPST